MKAREGARIGTQVTVERSRGTRSAPWSLNSTVSDRMSVLEASGGRRVEARFRLSGSY